MKLWIISDLHADHREQMPRPPMGAEIAIIAGDVLDDDWLVKTAQTLPVVFVAGNHEFYRREHAERIRSLSALSGVHFLENATVTLGAVRFVGSTLWTDYGRNQAAAQAARDGMNDHRLIKWRKEPFERFLPSHAAKLHFESRQYITSMLALPHAGPTVVVTHHAPHERSIHPRHAGQLLNRAFYSDLSDVIIAGRPGLWVHGHVHNCFDYRVGDTRVLCNPRGYPKENPAFNPKLLVDI